jgi:hypothetical protein
MGRSVTPNTGNEIQPVASAVGFLSGDLVYENTSGISRIPDNAVATATFPTNATVPDYTYNSASAGNLKYVENVGGGQFAPSVARLTNGNIVVAYGIRNTTTSTNNDVYFKIVDSNDTVVVAQTAVATVAGGVYMNYGSAGALALPNGGFVVVFHGFDGTNRRISYRVYNASGVAQTALITDTSVSTPSTYYQVAFAARSDSSFVVAFLNSSLGPVYRVYSAAGSTVYSGTFGATITSINGNRQLAVVVRSDDSYVLTSVTGGNAQFSFAIFSSTNTSLNANTVGITAGTAQHIDSVLLASDVVGICIYSSSGFIYYRSITGTSVSAESTLITGFTSTTFSGFAMDSFSSGSRFIVTYSFISTSTTGSAYNNSYKMSYAVFDSSGAVVTATQTLKGITVYTSNQVPAFVEVGSTLRIYMSPISSYNSQTPTFSPKGIYYAVINTANSVTIPQQSFTITSGTSPAQPVSGYVRAGSTPSSAQFFAASTSSVTAAISQSTGAVSTQVLGKTFLDSIAINSIASCYLGSGTHAVAYIGSGGSFEVKIAILNSSGTITNTISVGTSFSSANGAIRICRLGNGRIVVAYKSDASSISYRVYSPAYALLLSGIITGTQSNAAGRFGLSSLGSSSLANNYFIITYINSSNIPVYSVFADNSTTPVASAAADSSGNTWESTDVVGLRSGDFYVGGYAPPYGAYRIAYFANSLAGNTWSLGFAGNVPNTTTGVYPTGSLTMVTQDDIAVFAVGDAGTNNYFQQMASGNNANFVTQARSNTFPINDNNARFGISCTSEGDMFYANSSSNSGGFFGGSYPMPYGYSSLTTFSVLYPVTNASSVSISSYSPSFNNSALYAMADFSTSYPFVTIVYPISGSTVTNLTAGVSVSSSVPLTPTSYVLKGVGVTTCSAGGSGLIQTSGVAQLNTQYSSLPSQPFDFTNQITNGVRGILSGRTVTIEG